MSGSRQEIESEVLKRDNYRCRACGIGGDAFRSLLECHHLVPSIISVSTGVTLCDNCTLLLKDTIHDSGVANVDDISSYSDNEQNCIINIKKLARYKKDAEKIK